MSGGPSAGWQFRRRKTANRRVGISLKREQKAKSEVKRETVSGSRGPGGREGRFAGGLGSLADQAGEVEGQGEGVGDEHGLGGVLEAEPGRAFEVAAHLSGVAGFGIALATHAQLPGFGADWQVTGQADTAIRQAQARGEAKTEGMIWIDKLASLARREGLGLVG